MHATIHPDNAASLAALTRIGFRVTEIEDDSGQTVVLTCRRGDRVTG